MLKPEHLKNWVAFVSLQDLPNFKNFMGTLKKMGAELGIEVYEPMDM
jgi:hypothetical protein